jgi:hypothetical protein
VPPKPAGDGVAERVGQSMAIEAPVTIDWANPPAVSGVVPGELPSPVSSVGIVVANAAPALAKSQWLGDFVTSLGQSQKERNPTAGLKLSINPSKPAAKTGLIDFKPTVSSKPL